MPNGTPAPVSPVARIIEVDMIRGFALLGVLLVNMYGFGADSIAWNAPVDRLTFGLMRIFFESKSWTLFSMLFGFGFAVQLHRAEVRGHGILAQNLRRLAVLFAIGMAHALLSDGDILMLYAELGLVLLVVHRLPTRVLLILAAVLLLVFPLTRLVSPQSDSSEGNVALTVSAPRVELEDDCHNHVYVTGSLADVAADNANAIPADPLEDIASPESGLAVLAMLFVGFSIGREDVLSDIPRHRVPIARVRTWGLSVGLVAMVAERVLAVTAGYTVFRAQHAGPGIQCAGDLFFTIGTVALALGYAATIILFAQTPRGRRVLAPLIPVGRLALTVYLSQTLMFSTLFYGYGFGQAFRLGPVAVSVCAVAFFVVQVVMCQWWSKYFHYGPMEWLWRSLTYCQRQPLLIRSTTAR